MHFVCNQCSWCACGMHCVCSMCALSPHAAFRWAVEMAIQLAHDLGETSMPCVCIGVVLLGVLLDLPARIWNIVLTLHTRAKVCKVCMPDFCRVAHSGQVCAWCTLFQKKCAPGLHKVCRVCTCSAPSLQTNGFFFWGKRPVGENAHLMHT